MTVIFNLLLLCFEIWRCYWRWPLKQMKALTVLKTGSKIGVIWNGLSQVSTVKQGLQTFYYNTKCTKYMVLLLCFIQISEILQLNFWDRTCSKFLNLALWTPHRNVIYHPDKRANWMKFNTMSSHCEKNGCY